MFNFKLSIWTLYLYCYNTTLLFVFTIFYFVPLSLKLRCYSGLSGSLGSKKKKKMYIPNNRTWSQNENNGNNDKWRKNKIFNRTKYISELIGNNTNRKLKVWKSEYFEYLKNKFK